jgi:uncharacterized membrane protein YbhN (UPF0104 family)
VELRWVFLPALIALAASHYVLAAVALRAVAGRGLPAWDAVMTQLTAAAANRVTPSGLGGSAVNIRFLTCHGISLPAAIAAVAAMHVGGGLADLPLVVAVSPWAGGEMIARLSEIATDPRVLAVVAVVTAATLVWLRLRGRTGGDGQGRPAERRRQWASAREGLTDLVRRPLDLLVLIFASAATTLVMGIAFAVSVLAVPGAAGADQIGALIIAYLIGGTLGGLVPIPAGAGSTEAVLIASLTALDVATGPAFQSVLLFRVVTHWAPAAAGVLTARRALLVRRSGDSGRPSGRRYRGRSDACSDGSSDSVGNASSPLDQGVPAEPSRI